MRKNNRHAYIAAIALVLLALGLLIWSGLSQDSVYFVNVAEALALPQDKLGQARLFGTVDATGLERFEARPGVSFRLLDKDDPAKAIVVEYHGAVPDTFQPGAEVIVEGGRSKESGIFMASVLMTKCPSKYQKENR